MSVIQGSTWNPVSIGNSPAAAKPSSDAFPNLFQQALGAGTLSKRPVNVEASAQPNVDAVRGQVEAQRNALREKLNQLFAEEGFDTSEPILLELDEFGAFHVTNEHPNKLAIEEVLNRSPELVAAFRNLRNDASQLKSLLSGKQQPALNLPGQQEWLQDRGPGQFLFTLRQGAAEIRFV